MASTQPTFVFYRGVTFTAPCHYYVPPATDIDLTGKVVSFEITRAPAATYTLFSDGGANPQGSSVAITNAPGGLFLITITDEDTTLFDFSNGTWWIGLASGGTISRLVGGKVSVRNP